MLNRAPDPEAAAAALERFRAAATPDVRVALDRDASLLGALVAILGASAFLAEALIQSPELLLWLDAARREPRGRVREEWAPLLGAFLAQLPPGELAETARPRALARFKRREFVRIVWRDLLGAATLAETTEELSQLADALLAQAYAWAWNDLAARFGTPRGQDGAGAEMAVLALGKLGGEELNYSSDIDLMFLYRAAGDTAGGAQSTSNREFFTRLAQAVTHSVSAVTADGVAYRVDLRLRPGGREGDLALALAPAVAYYRGQARDWELQMLIRARVCAGSRRLGQEFLQAVQERVYPLSPQPAALAEEVRRTRRRISAQLERRRALGRRGEGVDVKLDSGGIRDIEFLVQYLQRLHGGADPWVRSGNTRIAMQRLHDKRRLGGAEFQQLSSAYELLRQIEHRLQLRLGQQTHTLPTATERLWVLARSLRLSEEGRRSGAAGGWIAAEGDRADVAQGLQGEIERRMTGVRQLYQAYLGAEGAPAPALAPPQSAPAAPFAPAPRWGQNLPLTRHGQRQLQRLLRSAATLPPGQAQLDSLAPPSLDRLALALNASDWMAETLIRRPALVADLAPDAPAPPLAADDHLAAAMAELRNWRQRQTLRLLLREWETRAPIAPTLQAHSEVAEQILQAALDLARRAAPSFAAPSFTVLALGRLGLGELDLLSDLDLVFLAEASERAAAAKLAAKFIEVLTAYTQAGSLYTVDTRLRPGGGEGELVQTAASLAAYFEHSAGVWEAISYLKARPVAGDLPRGAAAMEAVRGVLAQRFASGVERRQLAELRDRMEREGNPGRWGLKTAPGGYYDVDFIASRRWLQADPRRLGAGTGLPLTLAALARALPSGLLPAEVAAELGSLAEFLRAADHALRVATGKAGRAVPAAGEAIERAQAWLARIEPAFSGSLDAVLDAARARIRQMYAEWL